MMKSEQTGQLAANVSTLHIPSSGPSSRSPGLTKWEDLPLVLQRRILSNLSLWDLAKLAPLGLVFEEACLEKYQAESKWLAETTNSMLGEEMVGAALRFVDGPAKFWRKEAVPACRRILAGAGGAVPADSELFSADRVEVDAVGLFAAGQPSTVTWGFQKMWDLRFCLLRFCAMSWIIVIVCMGLGYSIGLLSVVPGAQFLLKLTVFCQFLLGLGILAESLPKLKVLYQRLLRLEVCKQCLLGLKALCQCVSDLWVLLRCLLGLGLRYRCSSELEIFLLGRTGVGARKQCLFVLGILFRCVLVLWYGYQGLLGALLLMLLILQRWVSLRFLVLYLGLHGLAVLAVCVWVLGILYQCQLGLKVLKQWPSLRGAFYQCGLGFCVNPIWMGGWVSICYCLLLGFGGGCGSAGQTSLDQCLLGFGVTRQVLEDCAFLHPILLGLWISYKSLPNLKALYQRLLGLWISHKNLPNLKVLCQRLLRLRVCYQCMLRLKALYQHLLEVFLRCLLGHWNRSLSGLVVLLRSLLGEEAWNQCLLGLEGLLLCLPALLVLFFCLAGLLVGLFALVKCMGVVGNLYLCWLLLRGIFNMLVGPLVTLYYWGLGFCIDISVSANERLCTFACEPWGSGLYLHCDLTVRAPSQTIPLLGLQHLLWNKLEERGVRVERGPALHLNCGGQNLEELPWAEISRMPKDVQRALSVVRMWAWRAQGLNLW
eukprot:jgi/Botrbrau1/21368/Bobra.0184s0074.1